METQDKTIYKRVHNKTRLDSRSRIQSDDSPLKYTVKYKQNRKTDVFKFFENNLTLLTLASEITIDITKNNLNRLWSVSAWMQNRLRHDAYKNQEMSTALVLSPVQETWREEG